MARPGSRGAWTSGERYDAYMGRWSRAAAGRFVREVSVPAGGAWLDLGCGTGALTEAILELATPSLVVGVDPSEPYARHAAAALGGRGARFGVADAHALPFRDEAFDACASALVINFLRDPPTAVREMRRVVRSGGVVAGYVWDYAEGMGLLRAFWDAAAAVDPEALALDEGRRFAVARPEPLGELFGAAGLARITVWAIEVETRFGSFEDLWSPFLGGQGPAPAYVASLPEGTRRDLAARLRERLPFAEDGTIALPARAWAVRAERP
ncbi:MAG TPA: class I SAM-dependent methyltransferase [Actinomycetota bacterium]|nr:class I SAM-dependent methyltransferase [Actinomycetota bacterium]